MNKSCTNFEQSKKLLELGLDPYTADMYWWVYNGLNLSDGPYTEEVKKGLDSICLECVPAWSLTTLLELMPTLDGRNPSLNRMIDDSKKWIVLYHGTAYDPVIKTIGDTPLDAAFGMVSWLLENQVVNII